MTIADVQFTPERWRQVLDAWKGEPQQVAGMEELRQAICQADPGLLSESASWLANFRKAPDHPPGIVTPDLMHRLTGYRAAAFDQHFCDDCNRLFRETGFDQHPQAMAMLMANMMHETANFIYMKELASGAAYNGRADLGNGPSDGPRFRGVGVLQLTGRYNYQRLADAIGDPRVMEGVDYVADKYPFTSAKTWIQDNHLLDVCLNHGFEACCVRINGGHNGYADRCAKYEICKREMG
jgi:predicted chitinase